MTDNEIIKVLECCKSDTALCNECPYDKIGECIEKMCADSIDLINRLQAQVKKCEKVEHFADKTIATLQAENKRLKAPTTDWLVRGISPEQLEKEKIQALMDISKKYAKAEAYKEFANELKCRTHEISYNTMQVVNKDDINNLLKELVGEDNAKEKE